MIAHRSRRLAFAFLLAVSVATAANAQFRGRFRGPSVKLATPEDFDGNFLFCRILFRNAPYGDGGGWGVDYPRADINLTFRLSELTTTTVSRHSDRAIQPRGRPVDGRAALPLPVRDDDGARRRVPR